MKLICDECNHEFYRHDIQYRKLPEMKVCPKCGGQGISAEEKQDGKIDQTGAD
jgi:rRNA maturation endonuclease Nob1